MPTIGYMERELWDHPGGPPARPAGVPDYPDGEWLEWVSRPNDGPQRLVWAWIRGDWEHGWVSAEGRTASGWWLFVWWPSNPEWVHEAATLPYAPTPEELAKTRAAWGLPDLSRDELVALIRKDFG